MEKLNLKENSKIIGGTWDWEGRYAKQAYKCEQGSAYACRRAARILARHQ